MPPLHVKSYHNSEFLKEAYVFSPAIKKHGEIKIVKTFGWNGGNYKMALFSEDGTEICDKKVWNDAIDALEKYEKETKKDKTPKV